MAALTAASLPTRGAVAEVPVVFPGRDVEIVRAVSSRRRRSHAIGYRVEHGLQCGSDSSPCVCP
jgi:hypothetical protein